MKLLATADWQAGITTISLEDQEAVWHRIVDVAIEENVELFLHGGDVVEGPIFTMEQLAAVRRVFNRLREAGIPILIVRGNSRHDLAMREVDALDVFRDYDGITVSDRPDVHVIAGVSVCTLPWVHPGRLLAGMNGSIDHDMVNEAVTTLLVDAANDLCGLAKENGKPAVLMAHWAISGAKLPSGLSVDELREPVLPWADLDAIGYDLIVGAHIHQPGVLSNPDLDRTPGFVVGSPQQLNFGEHGQHGCWVIDMEASGDLQRFVPIPSREFVTFDFDHPDPIAQIALSEDLGWAIPDGAIVRVRMRLAEQQMRELDQAGLRERLLAAGASQVRFDVDVEREARRRVEISESLSPVEAMGLYCDAAGIEGPLRAALLETIRDWSEQ